MVDKALFSSERGDWQTPDEIIGVVVRALGMIDLDPCSNSHTEPNVPACTHYTIAENGLEQPWHGRVYMNPPYGREICKWAEKLDREFVEGRVDAAISLVPVRTDTQWWKRLTLAASAVFFIEGRLRFRGAPTSAPFPSALVAHRVSPRKLALASFWADVGGRVYEPGERN